MIPKNYRKNLGITPIIDGVERREELAEDIIRQGTHLPRGVMLEDIDKSVIEFMKDELSIVINGEAVPVVLITSQRWSEFSQTWKFTNEFKNIKIPFIVIVRDPDVQVGTNQKSLWNIPGKPTYTIVKVPTWNGNRVGMSLYKIPQPTSVDVSYNVRLFTSKMRDLNKFSVKTQTKFNARQSYIYPNGHPQPLHLEGVNDESTIDDFENRRFYAQSYEFLLKGYILDEEDFIIEPAVDRGLVFTEISDTEKGVSLKALYRINIYNSDSKVNYKVSLNKLDSDLAPTFTGDTILTTVSQDMVFDELELIQNITTLDLTLDGISVTIPFNANKNQKLEFNITRNYNKKAKFVIKGTPN